MARKNSTYRPEFREMAVKEVIDQSRPIIDAAKEMGIVEQTLGNWVKKYREAHAEDEPEMSLPERARLEELERENRELRMENEFLATATTFFAKKHR